jgi:hypothetical protein
MLKFCNGGGAVIAATVRPGDVTIQVQNVLKTPDTFVNGQDTWYIQAVDLNANGTQSVMEYMIVTAINGNIWTVIRGQEGSSAGTIKAGIGVTARITGGALTAVLSQVIAGFTNPLTTNGDMLYQSGGYPTRLPVGAAGTALLGGSTPAWGSTITAPWSFAPSSAGHAVSIIPHSGYAAVMANASPPTSSYLGLFNAGSGPFTGTDWNTFNAYNPFTGTAITSTDWSANKPNYTPSGAFGVYQSAGVLEHYFGGTGDAYHAGHMRVGRTPPLGVSGQWTPVFTDDFNGTSPNETVWSPGQLVGWVGAVTAASGNGASGASVVTITAPNSFLALGYQYVLLSGFTPSGINGYWPVSNPTATSFQITTTSTISTVSVLGTAIGIGASDSPSANHTCYATSNVVVGRSSSALAGVTDPLGDRGYVALSLQAATAPLSSTFTYLGGSVRSRSNSMPAGAGFGFQNGTVEFRAYIPPNNIAVAGAVTACTTDGGSPSIISITCPNSLHSGDAVLLAGFSPAGINGSWTVSGTGLSSGGFQVQVGSVVSSVSSFSSGTVTNVANWPVLWLLSNQGWPMGGEIDIAEGLNGSLYPHFHGPAGTYATSGGGSTLSSLVSGGTLTVNSTAGMTTGAGSMSVNTSGGIAILTFTGATGGTVSGLGLGPGANGSWTLTTNSMIYVGNVNRDSYSYAPSLTSALHVYTGWHTFGATVYSNAPLAVTGGSFTSSTVTLTGTWPYVVPVGATVTVMGMAPSGYNGVYTVTASSAGSVTYANSTNTAITTYGTASALGWTQYLYDGVQVAQSLGIPFVIAPAGISGLAATVTGTSLTITLPNSLPVGCQVMLANFAPTAGASSINGVPLLVTASSATAFTVTIPSGVTAGAVTIGGTETISLVWGILSPTQYLVADYTASPSGHNLQTAVPMLVDYAYVNQNAATQTAVGQTAPAYYSQLSVNGGAPASRFTPNVAIGAGVFDATGVASGAYAAQTFSGAAATRGAEIGVNTNDTTGSLLEHQSNGTLYSLWDKAGNLYLAGSLWAGGGSYSTATVHQLAGTAPSATNGAVMTVNGTLTSTTKQTYAQYLQATAAPGSASTQAYLGSGSTAYTASANLSGGSLYGMLCRVYVDTGGNVAVGEDLRLQPTINGTVGTHRSLHIMEPSGSGSLTTRYGIQIDAFTMGSTKWGIYCSPNAYFAGSNSFGGTATPAYPVDATGEINATVGYRIAGSRGTSVQVMGGGGLGWSAITPAMLAGLVSLPGGHPASGKYTVPPNSGNSTSSTWTLGSCFWIPIDVPVATTFTGISMCINSLGTNGASGSSLIHVGLYPDDGTCTNPSTSGGPVINSVNTELTTDPTTGVTTTRDLSWGTPITLPAGRYWFAWMLTASVTMSVLPTCVTATYTHNNMPTDLMTSVSHKFWLYAATSNAGTLPSPAAPGSPGSGALPFLGLKAQ